MVDDEEIAAEHARIVLDEVGIHADTSLSGQEALQMLEQVDHRPVRLIGAGLYQLQGDEGRQLDFMDLLEENGNGGKAQGRLLELRRLGQKYGLDFEGNVSRLYHMETLHKTVEYMRKHR